MVDFTSLMINYINNKSFYYELCISRAKGRLTKEAINQITLIANHTIKKKRFSTQEIKDDCIQNGILIMLLNWWKFDGDKYDNPLAYFTEIFKRSIASHIRLYKKGINIDSCFNI